MKAHGHIKNSFHFWKFLAVKHFEMSCNLYPESFYLLVKFHPLRPQESNHSCIWWPLKHLKANSVPNNGFLFPSFSTQETSICFPQQFEVLSLSWSLLWILWECLYPSQHIIAEEWSILLSYGLNMIVISVSSPRFLSACNTSHICSVDNRGYLR